MKENKDSFIKLKETLLKEKKIMTEIVSLSKNLEEKNVQEKEIIFNQLKSLVDLLRKTNKEIPMILQRVLFINPLHSNLPSQTIKREIEQPKLKQKIPFISRLIKKSELSNLERKTLKRMKGRKEKIKEKRLKKPSIYVKIANKIFFDFSSSLSKKDFFRTLNRDLKKTNLQFIPITYISTILFTTLLSVIFGACLFLFFLFFNFGATFPIITKVTENIVTRFFKVFWILFALPIGIFLFMYFYPSIEKKSLANKIDQELPFATINMSAISGSMIDPSKIFSIIISTKEYPCLEKEFTKLINEINIYGYDLVSALRSIAFNSPSKKLSELFNGLATTITSGGDLREFFEKRSQSLLFEYKLEREKYTKSAETFMDIYISVVIAAPMILMLLVIMMKISGLGISLSTSIITLMMILGVSLINFVFLTFLHLKQPTG
ncbi:MAG: type II secretion system F family protein [archaeon]